MFLLRRGFSVFINNRVMCVDRPWWVGLVAFCQLLQLKIKHLKNALRHLSFKVTQLSSLSHQALIE